MSGAVSRGRRPVLLDCDTGIDDALALLYLAALARAGDTDVKPVGVVCTAGNVGLDDTLRNTLAWLDLAEAPPVPVCAGAAEPIAVPHPFTPETHGPRGTGHAVLPDPVRRADPRSGAQLWVEAARAHPGELIGVVTGPSSTLAAALEIEPDLPTLLRRLVVMGGTFFGHPGNTTPVAEWNVHVDPEAADAVCRAWADHAGNAEPVWWCGLHLTEQAVLYPRDLDRLPDTELARHVRDALRFYVEFHDSVGEGRLAHVHDPAVLHLALKRLTVSSVLAVPAHVRVECAGALTRGQTVADVRRADGTTRHGGPVNARILTTATGPASGPTSEPASEPALSEVVRTVVDTIATVPTPPT